MRQIERNEDQLWVFRHNVPLESKAFYGGSAAENLQAAQEFAGEEGRVASAPDIIQSLCSSPILTDEMYVLHAGSEIHEIDSSKALARFVVVHGDGIITPDILKKAENGEGTSLSKQRKKILDGKLPEGRELEAVISLDELNNGVSYDRFAVVVDGSYALDRAGEGYYGMFKNPFFQAIMGGEGMIETYVHHFTSSYTQRVRLLRDVPNSARINMCVGTGIRLSADFYQTGNNPVLATTGAAVSPLSNEYIGAKAHLSAQLNDRRRA